jgi:hypothetical protein
MRNLFIIAIISLIAVSCNKKHKYDNIPKLTFSKLSQNSVQAGSDTTLLISFLFEDGDGNIGFGTNNLFLKDSRDTQWLPYTIPVIPEKFNPDNGLAGVMIVDYEAAFLLLRSDSLHLESDTLTWDIYMKDQAGNVSNTITTSPLILTK